MARPSPTQRLRGLLWQWRLGRAMQHGAAAEEHGAWFDADHYRRQWPGLAACSRAALLLHYRRAGWQGDTSPHPLFQPDTYRQACQIRGLSLDQDPLSHWLQTGLELGLAPHPMIDLAWLQTMPDQGRGRPHLAWRDLHPWGAAAEALAHNTGADKTAEQILETWTQPGVIPAEQLRHLGALPAREFHSNGPRQPIQQAWQATRPWRATILGDSWCKWQVHALLQHMPVPLPPGQVDWQEGWPMDPPPSDRSNQAPHLVLHLQSLEYSNQQGLLPKLGQCLVLDPDPGQVRTLRRFGIHAEEINASAPIANPLTAIPMAAASCQLGLPNPTALAVQSTAARPAVVCLGSTGDLWNRTADHSCWWLPGFEQLNISTAEQARLVAAWLNGCQQAGLQLVRLQPPGKPSSIDGFSALATPDPPPEGWLPAQAFYAEITAAELQAELAWRRAGCPPPTPCPTPNPSTHCRWEHRSSIKPKVSVCVSLHNYASRIQDALRSVHDQTLEEIELIVVDDASSDAGAEVVESWLEQHGSRFSRALLLQHNGNAGLAAARNSAFAAASAPWCFVLDADNTLAPEAAARCFAIAEAAPTSSAVVHPLVALHYEQHNPAPRALLSQQAWHRELLKHGNYIDAMALVRRSAWQAVGGYTHIPGGWEDFDFWCKLAETGWHGVLCPQKLASYSVHPRSMATSQSRRMERALSRLLQHRHPWLELLLVAESLPVCSDYGPIT